MADRPIIFSTPMVRALLDGRKTQTRRLLKPQPEQNSAGLWVFPPKWTEAAVRRFGVGMQTCEQGIREHFADTQQGLPYATGDRLYVREAALFWRNTADNSLSHVAAYKADGYELQPGERWRPSIHMPRWASRLTLSVTNVRVQRLQDISEADAWAEGCKQGQFWENGKGCWPAEEPAPNGKGTIEWDCARDWYGDLWDSLHDPDAWDANPWVVALTFTVEQRNIDGGAK